MVYRSPLVIALGLLLAALPMSTMTVAADEPPSPLAPVYEELEPVCQELREKDPRKDHVEDSPDAPPPGAWDEFRYHQSCYQWRNDVQNDFYSANAVPSVYQCQKIDGRNNCVAVHRGACDVGLAAWGFLSLCMGMILPDE